MVFTNFGPIFEPIFGPIFRPISMRGCHTACTARPARQNQSIAGSACVCSPSGNGQHIVPFQLLNVRKAPPFCPHRHITIYSGKYVVSPSFPICVYPVLRKIINLFPKNLRKITNLFCRFLRKIKILSEDAPVKRAPLASRAGLCLQALLLTDFAESALHLR